MHHHNLDFRGWLAQGSGIQRRLNLRIFIATADIAGSGNHTEKNPQMIKIFADENLIQRVQFIFHDHFPCLGKRRSGFANLAVPSCRFSDSHRERHQKRESFLLNLKPI